MRLIRTAALLLPVWIASPCHAAGTPEATVNAFLSFYFGKYQLGVPGKEQLAELKPLLTPALLDAFERAAAAEACHFAKVGNSEPPLVEGDVFSSLFEGGKSASIDPAAISGEKAIVTVHWAYDDPADQWPGTKWDDRVFVEKVDGDWRIADFAHDGNWEFMTKGNVSAMLKEVAGACQ